ncbi:hypothetical protein NEI03_06470 [Brachyspira pilosicoli]|uniref:hypothetical protein n=1 Tax=Brachyspira pilosicoli TaxID=52584 RepID=UPI0025431CDA|nr:hypothetical protein [Brachyspira pilosicoli]WIH84843.1 hypothetical protein NEI03_06470 [Brachyspira pilosicoli]
MKNKKLFLIIYVLFVVVLVVSIIVLSFLGKKERVGYLSDFKLNIDKTLEINGLDINEIKQLFTIDEKLDEVSITNYIITNTTITNYNYDFRIKYYDKVFRNSDIYGVYPNVEKIAETNDYIKKIEIGKNGSPFGNLTSTKVINIEKIDNINYILKIKFIYYIIIILLILIILSVKLHLHKKAGIFLENKNIKLNISYFVILGYLYLFIPYIIFVATWIRYVISIPILILSMVLLYFLIKSAITNIKKTYYINNLILLISIFIITFIVLVSGIGELFKQGWDAIQGRNAFFRDLVNFSWPLIYPENGFGFVYYFAHWIVPSLFGKLFGFTVAKIILVLWSSLGIFISFILFISFIDIKNSLFVIVSLLILTLFNNIEWLPVEYRFGFASTVRHIEELYNQTIGVLVLVSLFLYQKNSSNFAFLGLSIVFYSPYAIVGIIPYMIVKVILDIKNNKFVELKNIFSASNILSSILIFPIYYLYLSSSSTMNDGFSLYTYDIKYFIYAAFLKFGIYIILTFKENKKNYIFYTSIFILLIVPFIKYSNDFNFYRTNIAAYFFIVFFVISYFYANIGVKSLRKYILILVIIYSSYNGTILYFDRQIKDFINNGFKPTKYIGKTTYNIKENSWILKTITCQDMDNSIFFKYIAKDKK